MTSFSISFPLDNGFIRRECPICKRQFKWYSGPTNNRPENAIDPSVYFCPYCGESAPPDQWLTKEQVEYIEQIASIEGKRLIVDELKKLERESTNGLIEIEVGDTEEQEPPSALHEPQDMIIIESPCHPWEPIKVIEDWQSPAHCLVCGELFSI